MLCEPGIAIHPAEVAIDAKELEPAILLARCLYR